MAMCRRPICVAAMMLIQCAFWRPASAQTLSTEFFRDWPLYEPLLAEPRPARTMLLVPGWSEEFPDSVKEGSRFAWQISLGDELPILALSNQQALGAMEKGRWGLGLWIPVSFHVIEDFKDDSAPIVDRLSIRVHDEVPVRLLREHEARRALRAVGAREHASR
jgi:hypothetical protein